MARPKGNYKIKYWLTKDGLALLRGWKRSGLADYEIAVQMGITRQTLAKFRKSSPEIEHALSRGRDLVNFLVEQELFGNTQGRDYYEQEAVKVKEQFVEQSTGRVLWREVIKIVEVRRHLPPSDKASEIFLRYNKPSQYSDYGIMNIQNQTKEKETDVQSAILQAIETFKDDDLKVEGGNPDNPELEGLTHEQKVILTEAQNDKDIKEMETIDAEFDKVTKGEGKK
jgi:hypothetical protein